MTKATGVPATTLRVGEPDVSGPLAVFPVFAEPARLEYRSFAEAAALGAAIHELDPASVNDVIVHNPLDVAVLLYEGEQIVGAQQDRTLDISVLVPAGARLQVPVSCVEAGRWEHERKSEPFAPSPQAAYPELRRAKNRAARMTGRAEQGEVWALVDARVTDVAASAPTGAMDSAYAARRETIDGLRKAIRRRDEQVGAVAAIGGELCVADVVGRADVFAALHGPLVSGYALDAATATATAAAPSTAAAQAFVDAALTSPSVIADGVGLGRHHRFAGGHVQGAKLVHAGELVALTAFAGEQPRATVSRPSRRR